MADDRDITERLEDPSYDGAIYMRQDAAKEIRRLREYSSKQALDIVALGQEVGRLREALTETLEVAIRNEDGPWVERARAALAEKGEK
jgi:hypothetical protein